MMRYRFSASSCSVGPRSLCKQHMALAMACVVASTHKAEVTSGFLLNLLQMFRSQGCGVELACAAWSSQLDPS